MTNEWVSEIWSCQRLEAKQNLTDFFTKVNRYCKYIMILYSILVLSFFLSEIEVKQIWWEYTDQT